MLLGGCKTVESLNIGQKIDPLDEIKMDYW